MEQPLLSKISIGTGADYALSKDIYNSIISWNKVIDKQFDDYLCYESICFSFRTHGIPFFYFRPSRCSWILCKRSSSSFRYKRRETVDFTELNKLIDEIENSDNTLLEKLPNDILNECKLMLEQFKRIAIADRVAAQSLKNNKLDSELKNLRQEFKDNESKAMVSELSLFFSLMKLFNYMNK